MGKSSGDRGDGSDKLNKAKRKIESLKREIDKLKKELNKANQFVQEAKNVLAEKDIKYDKMPRKKKAAIKLCDECGKGEYETLSITISGKTRWYNTCKVCGHRKIETEK